MPARVYEWKYLNNDISQSNYNNYAADHNSIRCNTNSA